VRVSHEVAVVTDRGLVALHRGLVHSDLFAKNIRGVRAHGLIAIYLGAPTYPGPHSAAFPVYATKTGKRQVRCQPLY
jgi:hypothetical protein